MNTHLIKAIALSFITQAVTYFQLQGQFIWDGWKKNPYIIAVFGYPISLLLIAFTRESALAFNGETWPGRLIGFAVGVVVFATFSTVFLKENMSTKTLVCIGLAMLILTIQIFWK